MEGGFEGKGDRAQVERRVNRHNGTERDNGGLRWSVKVGEELSEA